MSECATTISERDRVLAYATENLEFASSDWLSFVRMLLLSYAQIKPETATRTTCEVIRNVPLHLRTDGRSDLAWTRHVKDGLVTMDFAECSDAEADIKLVGDYEDLRLLARFVVTPDREEEYAALVQSLIDKNKIRYVKLDRDPRVAPDFTVHNIVAVLTS